MYKISTSFVVLLFFALVLSFTLTAAGQVSTGTIEGVVVDPVGSAAPGTVVSIRSGAAAAGYQRTVTADEKGYFVFAALPPGTYLLTVGQASNPSHRIYISQGETKSIELAPQPAGPAPRVSQSGVTLISRDLPRRITFSSLLKAAPEVRVEPLAGGFQINGASGSENVYSIDGQEVTNFRSGVLNLNNDLPFELLSEVQVRTSGFQARFAGAFGGSVTAATQGGNDRWRGNFGVSASPAGLQGGPNVILNRFGPGNGQFEYFQPQGDEGTAIFPTASLGGPVIKEKLWFFSSYSPQIYSTRRGIDYFTSTNPSVRTVSSTVSYESDVRAEAAFIRFDSQPVSRLRLFGSFLYNPIIQDGALPSVTEGFFGFPQAAGGLTGAEFLAERGGRANSNILNGQASWNVTDTFLLNFRAGRGFLNEKLGSYGIPRTTRFICSGSAGSTPGSGCSTGFQNISNNSVVDHDVSTRTTFDAEAGLFGLNAFGRHNLRFGYQLNDLVNDVKEGSTDPGTVSLFYGRPISSLTGISQPTPGNLGSGFLQRFGTVGRATSRSHAVFAQDTWQIGRRVTLDIGVRIENEAVPNYGGPDTQTVEFGWKDKVAPRLGFAVDLTGDGKTRIFGNYGWFYDRIKFELPRGAFGGTLFRRDFFEILPSRGAAFTNYTPAAILGGRADTFGGTCPIVDGPGFSVCQFDFRIPANVPNSNIFLTGAVDPNIEPARQTGYTVGLEREIFKNSVLGARYIHNVLDRAVEDIGAFNSQGSEAYILGNPGFGLACEPVDDANLPCAAAERRYDALELRFDWETADFFVNANYTFSRLYGNYSGLASSDEFGLASPNLTGYFNSPSHGFTADGSPDNGRLPTDRPHVFKAYGGYGFDWTNSNRTSVTAFTTIQSGTPLTTIYNLFGRPTSILFERGDLGRTETFTETDLMVSHIYRFGSDRRWSVEPYIIVLNLFDEKKELGRQTLISSTTFSGSALAQGGCVTCSEQLSVYDTLFNRGGIQQFVQSFLNSRGTSSAGFRNDYNLPDLFQNPRYTRFGFRFKF